MELLRNILAMTHTQANLQPTDEHLLTVGEATLGLDVRAGDLHSLGDVRVNGTPLRNPVNRFLPWFDSYDGGVFNRFRFDGINEQAGRATISLRAVDDHDYPFRERRDSSGDLCLRKEVWDAAPVEATFRVVIEPAEATFDGERFTGLRYWYEYESDSVPIHRMLDRQTWELGGSLNDVTLLFRSLFDLPMKKMTRDEHFSTVGLEKSAQALPGNLWARWSLLQPFDMQYGSHGVIVSFFDQVSNIRTVVESNAGEDWIRFIDLHQFENGTTAHTNPKTVLFSPAQLDEVDAINLWTRVFDREHEKACEQFGIEQDPPPRVGLHHEVWGAFDFDEEFEDSIELAAELGAEQICIGAVWESSLTFTTNLRRLADENQRAGTELDKRSGQSTRHKLHVLDYEVAAAYGGEAGLKRLCERAAAKGVGLLTWAKFALGVTGYLTDKTRELGEGLGGIYNTNESRRHPDSGYPFHTCSVNLHAPIGEHLYEKITGAMKRTGLKGFLWDSVSNMGWWQINYSDGTMRPQCEEMGRLYARLCNEGFYIQPEGIVSFSNHTAVVLHGGNIFEGTLGAFAYNSAIPEMVKDPERGHTHGTIEVLCGRAPFVNLFTQYAHKRVAPMPVHFFTTQRDEMDEDRLDRFKQLVALYKKVREYMQRRTVQKDHRAVLWQRDGDDAKLYWVLHPHCVALEATDAETGQRADAALEAGRVYWLTGEAPRGHVPTP